MSACVAIERTALDEALAELAEVAAQWKRLAEWEREQRKPRLVWSRPKEQAMTPRQKLTEQVVREFADNRSMTLAGGLRIDDLRAAAQTDEEPFLLTRRKQLKAADGGSF